ncbi:hypothetical protein GIY23_11720 [Allosaccharopolyspora coralli]|uniref:Uncharacterized protein n=1 Tax=Allosaccharopolyspora coralli TaxID=2665642 RepID=A0A5Q3QA86_9PSEU|nr:hypothetical protein [Allosaccharopolyspora coralli]QGK70104.1 hypothetical protein GIY23_11720 [Allosaccharopolyspora coralli]
MDASRLTFLLIRTAAVFAVAVVFAVLTGWSTLTTTAVVLTGAATVVQLGGVLYLRQQERQTW